MRKRKLNPKPRRAIPASTPKHHWNAATVTASYMTTILVHVTGVPVLVPVPTYSIVGFELVFGITSALSAVGLPLSLGLRNYRFHADGSRLEPAATAPAEGATRPEEPAVSAGSGT